MVTATLEHGRLCGKIRRRLAAGYQGIFGHRRSGEGSTIFGS
jgi:hypothetical protein